jgi:hypothetical protein
MIREDSRHQEGGLALGSDTPIVVDWTVVRARLQAPAVRAHFAAGNIDIVELMEPLATASAATLPPLGPFDPARVNTDMHPRDELPAPGRIARLLLGR